MKCIIVKWMISSALDSRGRFPAFVSKHIASCQDCRTFAAISDEMGMLLSHDAEKITNPSFLENSQASIAPFHIFGRAGVAAAFAACLMICTVFMMLHHEPQPAKQTVSETQKIITEYVNVKNNAAVITKPIEQFQNEINAIQKDLLAAKQRLIASSHVADEETVVAFLF